MNCGATAAFNTPRRSASPAPFATRNPHFGFVLIWHERLALIVPRWPRRLGGVGGRFRPVRRRLCRGLWRGVVLRWRDHDNQRREILGGGGKRRADPDQRNSSGESNGVGAHGRVPSLRSRTCAAYRRTSREGIRISSRPAQFACSRRPLRIDRRHASLCPR